ncbi:uncharacterized protein LOC135105158 [Scylla paramamosain]|uniref:uncharacterized protein LOC135105158 n=1 Tax=Scylla paramamosain TaxID=85552 RepID=UPI00308336E1
MMRRVWAWWLVVALVVVVRVAAGAGTETPLVTTMASKQDDEPLPPLPSLADLMSNAEERPLDTIADLYSYTKEIRNAAQTLIAKAFAARLRRRRRDLNILSVNVSGAEPYPLPFSIQAMQVTAFYALHTPEVTYLILGTYSNQRQLLVELRGLVVREIGIQLEPSYSPVTQITAVVHQGMLWVVFGFPHSVQVRCINQGDLEVQEAPTLMVHELGALHFICAEDKLYLVIGEKQQDSTIYRLERRKLFDQMEDVELRTKGVTAITGFYDDDHHIYYIVFGMTVQGGSQKESHERLQVYQLNVKAEPWAVAVRLLQEVHGLQVQAALQFRDLQDNNLYLAVLIAGAQPRIYWWNWDQLQEWQTLESPPVDASTSLAVVSLSNLENVLCLAHQNILIFYTDDLTGHYVVNLVERTSCDSLSSLQTFRVGQDHFIVYLCLDGATGTSTLQGRRLVLSERKLVKSVTRADELLACLEDLGTAVEARRHDIAHLKNDLATRPIMTVDGTQVWQGPITFAQGVTVTGTTTFTQPLVIQVPHGDVAVLGSSSSVKSQIDALGAAVKDVVDSSNRVLYFSEDQSFPGPVVASAMQVDTAHLGTFRIGKLNDLDMTEVGRKVLMMGVDQQINASLAIDTLTARNVTTRPASATINGVLTADFMRQSVRHQVVTGQHKYKDLSVSGSILPHPAAAQNFTINGIPISSMVKKGSSVTFRGPKTIKNLLVVGGVNARLVNGASLRALAQRVVYTDVAEMQTISGAVTLNAVHVAGNVDVMSLNGVDLRHLDANTVKTTGDFVLQGPVRYMKPLRVTGNMRVSVVNGVKWRDLLDRQSPHKQVLSRFTFTSAFVSHALVSDDINGLNLSEDVVLVDATQTIQGRVRFANTVTVTGPSGVLVDEGVTINNVDISRLLDNVANIGVLVVPEPVTFNQPLTCSGDITATKINGLPLEGIEERYWRKSVPQVVEAPVTLARAEFLEEVTGSSLNGLQMTDFLTYNTSQEISGTYEFTKPVVVEGDLWLGVGSTVNGVDLVALNRTVLSLYGDQTIDGPLVGGRVTVGYLDLSGTLNGLDPLTDFLRLDRTLQHNSQLTFIGRTVATQLTLAGNLTVASLNGLQVEVVARELVLRDQNATIRGPHVLHLAQNSTVVHLNVSGTLDGVDLNNLLSRALLKTSPPGTFQEMTGHLHVTGAVNFAHSLAVHTVNGKHFTSYLRNVVPRDYTGVIRGTKTFLGPVSVQGNLDAASINGRDLREFASNVFTKTGDQTIRAHYTFASATIDHLTTPTINNITMSQVLLVDKPGYLTGTTTFRAPLTVKGHLTSASTSLAGCDLNRLTNINMERGSDGSLHVYSPMTIKRLFVNGSVNAPAGVWVGDEVNLDTFLGSLVLKSENQDIHGSVDFLSHVTVDEAFVATINSVNISNMLSQSVLWNEEEIIECDLEFRHPIRVRQLVVRGALADPAGTGLLLGGVNVSRVAAGAVRDQGQTIVITGDKTFANGFTARNLIVNGSIDGVPVADLVTLSGNGPMLESAVFRAPITVRGNLKVHGLVDGMDLEEVFSNRIDLRKPQEVYGSCSFYAIKVLGDLEVAVINDVVLADLVLREGRAVQVVEGPKTFSGGLVVHGAINTTLLNGVDVVAMNRSLLRLDQPTTINSRVRFAGLVVAEKAVGGSVQGHDAQNLSKQLDQLKATSTAQYNHLLELHKDIDKRVTANLAAAQDMFVALHHLGWITSHPLPASSLLHTLSAYPSRSEDTLLLVKECGHTCKCSSRTAFYKVWEDGHRAPDLHAVASGSVFFLPAPSLQLSVILEVPCEGGGTFKLRGAAGEQTFPLERWSLGLVADVGIFVDNGMAYVVTAGRLDEATNVTRTTVVVLRVSYDHRYVERIWGQHSRRSASKLDLTQIGSTWYLVVANEMELGRMNKYTTVSTLYVWASLEESFIVQRNYIGHRVTSAMFLKVTQPLEEHFLVLAQLRAASHHSDTRVLVYKHDTTTGTFEEFQVVPTSDVGFPATLYVGTSLYMLLLSEEERLDVYCYIPLEGFRLQQSVGIPGSISMAVIGFQDGSQQVWVSTEAPAGLQAFKVWHKGVDPSKL